MNREDLKNYSYSQKWIKEQLERYQEQKTTATRLTQDFDGMPKAHNKPNYMIEELIDKYNEIIKILINEQEKQNKILDQIRLIKEPYRTILTNKYIDNMSLEEISINIHYSYDRTCKMHGIALNMFDEINKSGQ